MASGRLFICLLSLTVTFALPSSRILEGEDATSGQFPWIVSVRLDNAHVCVGNIIDRWHVLTAGHCVSQMRTTSYQVSRVNARVGSINQYAGGQIVSFQSITIHPSYGDFLHDLAVLKLKEPLVWSDRIKSIELVEEDAEIPENTEVTISGWGLQKGGTWPYKLQQTKMHSLDFSECEYRAGFGYDSVMCLDHPEKQGICRGDDGAGAVANNRLVGIMSFAFGNCGTKYPDVATRLSYYHEWLQKVTA